MGQSANRKDFRYATLFYAHVPEPDVWPLFLAGSSWMFCAVETWRIVPGMRVGPPVCRNTGGPSAPFGSSSARSTSTANA